MKIIFQSLPLVCSECWFSRVEIHQPNPSWRLFVSSVRWLSFWALPLPSLTMCHWWRRHRSSIKHSRRVGRPVIARGERCCQGWEVFSHPKCGAIWNPFESSKSQGSFVFFWGSAMVKIQRTITPAKGTCWNPTWRWWKMMFPPFNCRWFLGETC